MTTSEKRIAHSSILFFALFIILAATIFGETTSFILSMIGSFIFYYNYYPSPDPVVEPVKPPDELRPHPNWGFDVVRYTNGLHQRNAATVEDIVNALGSNYPLDYGKKAFEPESQAGFEAAMEEAHFDGHLYIGGGLYWDGKGHILTTGSARTGFKGSSLIMPDALSLTNLSINAPSRIYLDPKGEILAVAGKWLKRCGYNVVCINPFDIPEVQEFGKSGFNVFETFSADTPDFDKYSDMIANAICPPVKNSNEHFQKAARNFISFYIRHMMTQNEEPKNFTTLYRWLRLAGPFRQEFLEKMVSNTSFDGDVANEALSILGQLGKNGNDEIESIYSTIRTLTDTFKNQQLRDSISKSDFDITKVAQEKTAIFVCMNPSDLEDNQAWLRILFGSFIRALTRYYNKDRKVVMVMDEFPTMGYFREFEVMSGFMAGYNVTLWPIVQDLTQLKGLYPTTWETFINNAVIRHFTSVGDNFTAEYVARRMPIVDKGTDDKPHREPLWRADQVMNEKNMFVFITGVAKPAIFRKTPYWNLASGRSASPNPFH